MDWQSDQQANQHESAPPGNQTAGVQSYDIREPVGYALLLGCNSHPSQQHPSPSIREDLLKMQDTMSQMGWKVFSPCLGGADVLNLTGDSCEQIVNNLESPEIAQCSCFMLYYSGHGVASGIIGSNGRVVSYKEIVTKIGTLNAITGKPKIFIFDCCRHTSPKVVENVQNQKVMDNLQNQIVKANQSYSEEIADHLRQDRLTAGYPPPDCVLCFSACEGSPGFMERTAGSYFTSQLSRTLLQLSRRLSLIEMLTQVSGGTVSVSSRVFGVAQQPVWISTLNRHLMLTPTLSTSLNSKSPELVSLDCATKNTTPANGRPPTQSEIKGPYMPRSATDNQDVVSDAVRAAGPIQRRRVFKSRTDVVNNLTKLGEGVSVFVVYAPDPESPYHDPSTRQREIYANEKRVFQLVYDLECHGFHTVTDLHLGNKMPANWLEWYTSRIEFCDYVLLVGSPAFCELFTREKQRGEIVDKRAKLLLSYSNAVYAEIAREISNNPGASKFIPVLLDPRWSCDISVPSLIRSATVYHLLEDGHRQFNYDDGSRDFEKLVCRMAGINRMEIDRPQVVGVQPLPPPYHKRVVHPVPMPLDAIMKKPRTGYKVVRPPNLPRPTSSSTAMPAAAPTFIGGNPHPYRYPPPHPHQPVAAAQPTPALLVAGQQVYHPSSAPGGLVPPLLHHPQPLPMVQPIGSHYPTVHTATVPLQPHIPQQPLPPTGVPSLPLPSSLPDIEPDKVDMFMWLSDNLVGWPFIARYLGFAEPMIERVKEENPHNVSEQCYQMFNKWYRQRPSEFSCRKLGEALFKSERNRHLYSEFVKRVMDQQQRQDMDTQ